MTVLWWVFVCIGTVHVLAQYHQTDYGVKLERVQIPRYNHSICKSARADLVWYNRTQRAINGSADLLQDFTTDLKIDIQVYKFLSNEYRFFPITFSGYMCDSLKKDVFGLRPLQIKYSNMLECPPKAGFYYMRNAVVDFSSFPPYIPAGQYKLTAMVYYRNNFVFELDCYATVITFITKWEASN